MDKEIRRNIILEHYQNPFHKGLIEDQTYLKVNVYNVSCIDNITLMMKLEDNFIQDIRFDGEACAISTSATSILIEELLGKTKEEALIFLNEYEKMINEEEYNKDILGQALVYEEIYLQPIRKRCALLPSRGIKEILEQNKKSRD
ncbi:MAG: Fe-S cluster assembly sulfur transfer protein SufU [Bacilli bacterium]|jgi:nitrogen fixation NifU-like protein